MTQEPPGPLVHHELCFGCGRTNLFGLLLEIERTGPNEVAGRCFIKQDHQGAERGDAHEGILAAALSEVMALACGIAARPRTFEMRVTGAAAVGTFVDVTAHAGGARNGLLEATATAAAEGVPVAEASGTYRG